MRGERTVLTVCLGVLLAVPVQIMEPNLIAPARESEVLAKCLVEIGRAHV